MKSARKFWLIVASVCCVGIILIPRHYLFSAVDIPRIMHSAQDITKTAVEQHKKLNTKTQKGPLYTIVDSKQKPACNKKSCKKNR